jgi:iron complex outermembrane receptor protein
MRIAVGTVATGVMLAFVSVAYGAETLSEGAKNEGVEEIIVTAQRIRENLQKVPIAMTVVSGDTLKERNIYDPSQLPFVAPSLQLEGSNDSVGPIYFFVRGVGTAIHTVAGESSVGTVIDGVAMSRPDLGIVQFFDIQQVEILRGPQGFLFGKNASAGLVNITTTPPKLGEYESLAHLEYGRTTAAGGGNEYVAQGTQNIPLGENQALRLDVYYTSNPGVVRNLLPGTLSNFGEEEDGARLKYLWSPNDRLDIYAIADVAVESGMGGEAQAWGIDRAGGFLQPLNLAVGVHAGPTNIDIASPSPYTSFFTLGGGQIQLVYHLNGGFDLTNMAAWRTFKQTNVEDPDFLPQSIFDTNIQSRSERQFSEELRLSSPSSGALTYQLGLYYLDGRYEQFRDLAGNFQGIIPFVLPPGVGFIGSIQDEVVPAKSYAVYGQAVFHATDRFRVIAGGRFTHDDLSGSSTLSQGNNLRPLFGTLPLDQHVSVSNFSGRAGLEFDLAPESMAYFTFARGYKGPAINDAPDATTPLRPEIPTSLELGLKSTLFDHRLVLNAALFHTDFSNYQGTAFNTQVFAQILANAGELRTEGVELDLTAKPISDLTLTAAATYDNAYYVSFKGQACYPLEAPGTGPNQCDPDGASDASGNRLENAPRWSASTSANYEHPLSSGLRGFIRADYYYRTGVNYSANGDPSTAAPGYGILGASFGISSPSDSWRLSVFARNLLDKRFVTYLNLSPALSISKDSALGGDYLNAFGVDSFRTVGVSLDAKF